MMAGGILPCQRPLAHPCRFDAAEVMLIVLSYLLGMAAAVALILCVGEFDRSFIDMH